MGEIYNQANQYQLDANQFCSPSFYGDNFDIAAFVDDLEAAAEACKNLDKYKRALFYDDRAKYALDGDDKFDLPAKSDQDFIHAVLGLVTEAGEIGELAVTALDNWIGSDGATLEYDVINAKEEGGDILWYSALLARATGYPLADVMTTNINKLDQRYKNKTFSTTQAQERDLEAERAILEA